MASHHTATDVTRVRLGAHDMTLVSTGDVARVGTDLVGPSFTWETPTEHRT